MNWKKALLVSVLAFTALIVFAVAAVGLLATAGLATAAVAISESGVVQAFEEVAVDAERLQIVVDENSVTFTNPDSGESRTVTASGTNGRGRIDLSFSESSATGAAGESRVIVPALPGVDEPSIPEITITDPDSGQSRVIRPNADIRVPRVVWDDTFDWTYHGPELGLRIVGGIFRGLFNLAALVLIAAGVYLLIRNRRQAQANIDNGKAEKTA